MKRATMNVFLTAEIILYCAFLLLDLFTSADTKWLKFAAILLVALMGFRSERREITAALCLTAAADVFLLVLDRWYDFGILLFIIVQLLYAVSMRAKKTIFIQFAIVLIAVVLYFVTGKTEIMACGYITVFLCNLIHAGIKAAIVKDRKTILFFTGLALFFCCDLCVGYYNIGTGPLRGFCSVAMWGFYLPGQVMILLSAIKNQGDNS